MNETITKLKTEEELSDFLKDLLPDQQAFEDMRDHDFYRLQIMLKERFGIGGWLTLHQHLDTL